MPFDKNRLPEGEGGRAAVAAFVSALLVSLSLVLGGIAGMHLEGREEATPSVVERAMENDAVVAFLGLDE